MYLFRARDRRLMEQTARDVALTLQRDYFNFGLAATGKKSTEISTHVSMYDGYLSTGANAYPNISWTPGSEVDAAFVTLEQLVSQLSMGTYQKGTPVGQKNNSIWPVASITWSWIKSLYVNYNPAYAAWLTANNFTVPNWGTHP